MTKTKKIVIGIIAGVIGFLLLVYLFFCCLVSSRKPGMDGFTVTNGMIRLLISGEDYLKVGEDRYLYREGSLKQIIENEYDSYTFIDDFLDADLRVDALYESGYNDSSLSQVLLVVKDGVKYNADSVGVWCDFIDGFHSLYYEPYKEGNLHRY